MNTPSFSAELQESLAAWLKRTLGLENIEAMLPAGDPLRTWWKPEPPLTAVHRLVALLCGGNDHLTLLALVQRARTIAPLSAELEERLSIELNAIALNVRTATPSAEAPQQMETFLSYAHEDKERAAMLGRLLRSHGVRLYRDEERIQPGENITARLYQVMSIVKSAVVIVSRFSLESEWVHRELENLVARRESSNLLLLPILVDDVALPELIADLFTIDLRGYRGEQDDTWAYPRLQPLIQRVLAVGWGSDGPNPRRLFHKGRHRRLPMKFEIESTRTILEDFFKVEEAHLRYEQFDGTMSKVVRRLNLERGDSVAAILVNRRLGNVILVKQFRYPTCSSGSGWVIEAIAGMLSPDESPEEAIRREIEEEAGYRVENLTGISTFFVSPGGSSERIFLYCAEVDGPSQVAPGGGNATEEEDIQVLEFPIGALPAMLEEGEIFDAKTIIGLQWLLVEGRQVAEEMS